MYPIGKTAKYLRERRGLTLRAAAESLGITHVHLCNVENGKATPSLDLLDRLREVYGVDVATLAWCLYGDVSKLPKSVQAPMRALAAAWRRELGGELADAGKGNG
jgi:transcriptional regulator with XRE-family HTH domain